MAGDKSVQRAGFSTYLRLPILEKVIIENFSLYKEDLIELPLFQGINAIVGGNGLGKTTIVNLIKYAIIGIKEKDDPVLHKDYFKHRMREVSDYGNARVTMFFKVRGTHFKVTRMLAEPKIVSLVIDESEINGNENNKLEDLYKEKMIEACNVDNFDEIWFIVSKFLISDEDRKELVWDNETQSRLLRLLFHDKGFAERYEELYKDFEHAETEAKHARWDAKKLEDRIEILKESREKSLEEVERGDVSIIELEESRIKLEEENEKLQEELESVNEEIGKTKNEYDSLRLKRAELYEQLGNIDGKLLGLELKLNKIVYPELEQSPVLDLAKIQMETRGRCIFCNAQNNELKNLSKEMKKKNRCFVCGSNILEFEGYTKKDHSETIKQHKILKANKSKIMGSFEPLDKNIETSETLLKNLKNKFDNLNDKINSNNEKINECAQKISYLEAKSEPEKEVLTPFDKLIEDAKNRISEYEGKKQKAREEKQKYAEELTDLKNEMFECLEQYGDLIRENFERYASAFLGTECNLELIEKKDKKGVLFDNFFPKFNNKIREKPTSVSDSQRLFLDHAFRMAVSSIYKETTRETVFYIAETPEGTLDLAYLEKVAEMFVNFGEDGHTVIITSNLNRVGFLDILFKKTTNPSERILNLMEIGRLSDIQIKSASKFDEILSNVIKTR